MWRSGAKAVGFPNPVGQLPQTGYLSMLTPYSYFGLGRTNNYVESLFVGSTRHQDEHFMSIEGVIPNSQVVVVPYQPEDVQNPGTWSRQLFLMPGRWIPWVGVTLVASMIILATVVLVLHINEKVGTVWGWSRMATSRCMCVIS